MKKTIAIFLLTSLLCLAAPFRVYDSAATLSQWKALRNLTLTAKGDILVLSNIQYDSSIVCEPVEFNPEKFNTIRITYRATGIPASTRGQVFFRNDKKGAYGAHSYFILPSLKGDGELHTVTTSFRDMREPDDWKQGGTVRSLRIDMMDQEGGTIEIHKITLDFDPSLTYPPAVADEPIWQNVKPDLTGGLQVTGEPYFTAKMLCHPKDAPRRSTNGALRYQMRKSFQLTQGVTNALVQACGDDSVQVFLNGTPIADNSVWHQTTAADVPANLFTKGENVLAIDYRNARSAGGAMAELCLLLQDGTSLILGTDDSFTCAIDTKDDSWKMPGFNDSNWSRPLAFLPPPSGPWRTQIRFIDGTLDGVMDTARNASLTAKAGESVPLQLSFKGTILPKQLPLDIQLKDPSGKVHFYEHKVLEADTIHRLDGTRWEARFSWQAPRFLDGTAYTLEILPTTLKGNDWNKASLTYVPLPKVEKKDTFGVMRTPSGMQFHKNGTPFYMVCGNVCKYFHVPVFFNDAAVNVRVCYTDGWWLDEDTYDFGIFDNMVESLYRTDPNALLLMDINLDLPKSFHDNYLEEMTCDSKKVLKGGRVEYSFASKSMLERMKKALTAALTYCENSRFSNRILGYRLTSGDTTEWLSWPWSKSSLPDYSKPARQGFANYLKAHVPSLPDTTPIPSEAARQEDDGEVLLKDVTRHLPSLAYHDFYSWMIADACADICIHARSVLGPNRAIGTYYGYTCHVVSGYFPAMRGHFALQHLLNKAKGSLDFLMSPQSYRVRRLGMTSVDMKPFQTLEAHQIIPIIEDDTRTSDGYAIERFYDSQQQALTPQQSVDTCWRNMGIAIARLQPLMLYSLTTAHEFALPQLTPCINAALTAGDFAVQQKITRRAEIAVVFSESSPKYVAPNVAVRGVTRYNQYYDPDGTAHRNLADGGFSILGESATWQMQTCAQLGAPADAILAEELPKHLDDYKLYIFTDCYAYDDAFLKAVQELKKRNVTLLWLYAPGLYHKETASVDNMRTLTGLPLERAPKALIPAVSLGKEFMGITTTRIAPMFHVPKANNVTAIATYLDGNLVGLAETRCGNARSVFSGAYKLNLTYLQKLARESGVFIYSDTRDPLEANDAFVTLHARNPGQKTLRFPAPCDVLNVLTGDIVARQVTSYTFQAPLHSSWLFYYGPKAENLRAKLREPKMK